MQEKRGVTHINMMDLLQQYAIGNGELKSSRSSLIASVFNESSQLYYRFPMCDQLLNIVGGHTKVDNEGNISVINYSSGSKCCCGRFLSKKIEILEINLSWELFFLTFRHARFLAITIKNCNWSSDAWGLKLSTYFVKYLIFKMTFFCRWKCRRRQKLISFLVIRARCVTLLNIQKK